MATLPNKDNLLPGKTAGEFATAIGQLYDYTAALLPLEGGAISGDLSIGGKTTLAGALHQANPVSITSNSGILTLTEEGNSFVAGGAEPVTSISGWGSGIAAIRWNTARTLTNSPTLILQNAANRKTAIGDIGFYEMTSAGARELIYFPAVVNSVRGVPVGTYIESACPTAPEGYLLADGSAMSRTVYADLFAAIGTTYGAGDGSTTFNLPNRRDRMALAKGTTYSTLGGTGGETAHILSISEMPSHTHQITANVPIFNAGGRTYSGSSDHYGTEQYPYVSYTGGGAAHNNMPPYIVVNIYIKY